MSSTIREPRLDELERLRDIEWAAGTLFVDVGLDSVAADPPASVEVLAEYTRAGRAFVATDGHDVAVGYAIVDVVDGLAHLEQLSVLPDHGRQGLGRALIGTVCAWATRNRYEAVTLTTFTDVSWNAPYYARHGFRVLTDDEVGPELRSLRALEAEHGLDPDRRVCMRRDLAP